MNVEQTRLDTFRQWPNESLEPSQLAKAGFFATGNGFEVQCHWCSTKVKQWANADEVIEKHNRLSANCPFLVNSQESSPASHEATGLDLMNEQNRLATFQNWPITFITAQSLAKAGFYYLNRSDHVRCAWCQGEIGKWEVGDNPFTEHLRFFPNCLWAQLGPNVEVSSEEPISSLGIQQIRAPKKERYSSLDARIRSFANWPMTSIQSPETLATAGFYYQNTDDQVRCFQCNGGLRSWQHEDDAWFEHARWFPKCEFVQLVKGKQYIAQVQQQSRPTLEEAMDSEPVQKALEMGLNAGRIRAVTKYHLEHFGGAFKCAENLIDVVLDYQREEELQQRIQDEEDDDEITGGSSAIVREVGRILDTIFKHTRNSTTASTSSTASPVPSTSASLSGNDDGAVSCMVNADTEPTIRLTDDFVVVEIPQGHSTAGGSSHPNNIGVSRDEIGFTTTMPTTQSSRSVFMTPMRELSHTSQCNQNITPPPSTSFVPENSRITNSEVPPISTPTTMITTTTDATAETATISEQRTSPSQTAKRPAESSETEKSLSLEEENRQLRDARLCKVCMDGDVAVVFLPCGHLVTCVQCAPSVTACPLCRTAIKAFVRTFLS